MDDKYQKWDKIARDEVKKTEDEEKEGKIECDKALGLEDGPSGPPKMIAMEERKEQAKQQTARNEVIQKMKKIEKTVCSPDSGDIVADRHGVRIVKANDVTLNVVQTPIKVFLDECSGTCVRLNEQIVTSTLEIYRCDNMTVEVGFPLATVQLDSVSDCLLSITHEDMVSIIHDGCTNLRVKVGGEIHNISETSVQSVSKWKDNAFITVAIARDEGKFPVNVQDISSPGAEQTEETAADKYKNEGNSAFKASDFVQAAAFYSQSLDVRESDVVYCNRSQCWLKMGQFQRALDDAIKAQELNPANTKAYFRHGIALHALERYAEAIPILSKAEDLDPKNKQISDAIRMAQLKARQGDK